MMLQLDLQDPRPQEWKYEFLFSSSFNGFKKLGRTYLFIGCSRQERISCFLSIAAFGAGFQHFLDT